MRRKKKPAYLLHPSTGQARVRINGRDIYLGKYGSRESREEYERQVARWFGGQTDLPKVSIDDLCICERNGGDETVYELEALEPADMLRSLEDVVTSVLDMDLFNREAAIEQEEAVYLQAARQASQAALASLME